MEQQKLLKFPGFPSEPKENYWRYPKIINGFWHTLTGSEQKVLDYILRHTWGFKKNSDFISREQFENGVKKKDGFWLDRGTGLSQPSIGRALKGLEKKGFIIRIRKGKKQINEYVLKLVENPVDNPESDCSKLTITPPRNDQSPPKEMINPYTIVTKTINTKTTGVFKLNERKVIPIGDPPIKQTSEDKQRLIKLAEMKKSLIKSGIIK